MSVKLMAMVFDCDIPTLETSTGKKVSPSTAKFLLIALADHANEAGESIYPSISRLAKKTGFTEQTVLNGLNALKYAGFITYEGVSNRGTSEYKLEVKMLEDPPTTLGAPQHSLVPPPTTLGSTPQHSLVKPSVNHPLNTNNVEEPEQRKPRTAEDLKASILRAIEEGGKAHAERALKGSVNHFPPEVQAVIEAVCDKWKIVPPYDRKASKYKWWIAGAKELKEACGEFGIALLDEVYEAWKPKGFFVSSPASLANVATAVAGRKRGQLQELPPAVDPSMSYAWNSELSEEENLRLMRETMKRAGERKGREGQNGE